MRTNTTTLLLALVLAGSSHNCGGSDDGLEVCSGTSSTASCGTASSVPNSGYFGNWAGTWTLGDSDIESGSISARIAPSGALTGDMEYSGSAEQHSRGSGTLTGEVSGSAVRFSYQFSDQTKISGSGSLAEVSAGEMRLAFVVDGSDSTGHFDLGVAPFKARILDQASETSARRR